MSYLGQGSPTVPFEADRSFSVYSQTEVRFVLGVAPPRWRDRELDRIRESLRDAERLAEAARGMREQRLAAIAAWKSERHSWWRRTRPAPERAPERAPTNDDPRSRWSAALRAYVE